MFIGEYKHILDPKGRVIMPSKFRDDLGEICCDQRFGQLLICIPQTEWQELERKLRTYHLPVKMQEHLLGFSSRVLLNVNWINREEF